MHELGERAMADSVHAEQLTHPVRYADCVEYFLFLLILLILILILIIRRLLCSFKLVEKIVESNFASCRSNGNVFDLINNYEENIECNNNKNK